MESFTFLSFCVPVLVWVLEASVEIGIQVQAIDLKDDPKKPAESETEKNLASKDGIFKHCGWLALNLIVELWK